MGVSVPRGLIACHALHRQNASTATRDAHGRSQRARSMEARDHMTRPPVDSAHAKPPVGSFTVEVAIAMGVFTTLVFIGIFWRTIVLVQAGAREQATSYIDLITNARTWNATHGGVWVVKGADAQTNPYLRTLGVEPDTSTVSGTQLTLRNPAVMTKEMSRIADEAGTVRFHLTSLDPINPENAPDAWERSVLEGFSVSRAEVANTEDGPDGHILRVMRPLVVEQGCLTCHAAQGYEVGDIRGAISLVMPLTSLDRSIVQGGLVLFGIYALVIMAGGAVGYWLISRMATRIERSESALQILATTDPLTGIPNRRTVLHRLEEELARTERLTGVLGVLEVDIDHFKRVNDTHGHPAGDAVLREVARRISSALREYDVAGRIGGEEFLVVAPEMEAESLLALGERLRACTKGDPIIHGSEEIVVTSSVGATLSRPGDTVETIFARADLALYAAKEAGRNRVELG